MQYREYADMIRPKAANIFVCLLVFGLLWSGVVGSGRTFLSVESFIMGTSPLAFFLNPPSDFSSMPVTVISGVLMLGVAYAMVRMNEMFPFIPVRTLLPAFFAIVIISLVMRPHPLPFGLILMLLFALLHFSCFRLCEGIANNPSVTIFNIGLLFGISMLFALSSLVFILPLLVFLYQIKQLSTRGTLAFLFGIVIPPFYTALGLMLSDKLPLMLRYFAAYNNGLSPIWSIVSDTTILYLIFLTALTFFAMLRIMVVSDHQNIKSRQEVGFICMNFIFAAVLMVAGPADTGVVLPLFLFFSSFILGHCFSSFYNLLSKILWGLFIAVSLLFLFFPTYEFG